MAWSAKTYTFSPSTTIFSAQVNQNFDDLVDDINTAMPSGGIIIWSGAVASIPSGWYLCNGSNSTPDLRGKFVYGAGGSYAVGDTGGEETHTLTEAEMPAHSHATDADKWYGTKWASSYTSSPVGADVAIGFSDASTSNTGGGAAHNNLPPYYALAFIMKS